MDKFFLSTFRRDAHHSCEMCHRFPSFRKCQGVSASLLGRIAALLVFIATSGLARAEELLATLKKVEGGKVTFSKQTDGGMGKGKGRGMQAGGQTATLGVVADLQVTSASISRRTQAFQKGADLGGGLANPVFKNLGDGLKARIITDGTRITAINVVMPESNSEVIAVRPKRPPSKSPGTP